MYFFIVLETLFYLFTKGLIEKNTLDLDSVVSISNNLLQASIFYLTNKTYNFDKV